MTYGHESSLWFKIDASIDAETGEIQEERWAELKSRLGVHQGRPLSCFLAALGLAKCLNAAQAAHAPKLAQIEPQSPAHSASQSAA